MFRGRKKPGSFVDKGPKICAAEMRREKKGGEKKRGKKRGNSRKDHITFSIK